MPDATRLLTPATLYLLVAATASVACDSNGERPVRPEHAGTQGTAGSSPGDEGPAGSAESSGEPSRPGADDQGDEPAGSLTGPRPCEYVEEGWGPEGDVAVRTDVVVDGLEVPWGLVFLPGGDLLVSERPGRLRLVHDGRLRPEPLATVEALDIGEGGLLGLEAHPDMADNGLFYLYATVRKGGEAVNQVEQWRLRGEGAARQAERVRVVLGDIPAARYHNGGRLRVGPDRKLYIGTGDAREPELSQDPESLAGKILRLELDGSVPSDNPTPGSPVYLLGIRNTQGFDWREDGTVLVTDHGPSGELGRNGHDEVSVVQPGDNLGWPTIYRCEERDGMVRPSVTWQRALPPGGAALYTGDRIPEWRGSLLVGALGGRHLHRLDFEPGTARVRTHGVYFQGDPPRGLGRLREVMMGPDGHLYVTTSNCDGRGTCPPDKDAVLRILPD